MDYRLFVSPKLRRLLWAIPAVAVLASNTSWAQQMLAPTNFGSQAIGTSSGSQTLTFSGLPSVGGVTQASGVDFTAVPTCGLTSCTVSVTFTPKYPGLRQDAVLVTDSTGHVVGIGPVYGIGTGPQIATGPGLISTVANQAASALSSAIPTGVAIGPGGRVYISDYETSSVYYIDPASGSVTRYAGNGTTGYSGDGGAATSAELNRPAALAFDASANLYIADYYNHVIREVIAATQTIVTVAGNGTAGFSGDGGAATSAQLNRPSGIAVDAQTNLYIADTNNNRIRKVSAVNGQITGSSTISTFAGNGTAGFGGDGSAATSAMLSSPMKVALDANGNLFIADSNNDVVRKVSGGNISTVAGTGGSSGYSGDGGPATSALLNTPEGIAVDAGGSLYISDSTNNVIRKVTGDSSHTISTIAGTGLVSGYAGDGGPATSAKLNFPMDLALDSFFNIFVVDNGNSAIRKITSAAAPLSFGSPQTVTVSNTGNQALSLSGISVSGSNYSQSGGTCSTSTPLAAGASCTIVLSFSPPGSGTAPAGSLLITSNSLNQSGGQSSISLNQSAGLHFIPMTPCRAVDTRVSDGFSGSFLAAGSVRSYVLPNTPNCTGIPGNALAYSLNVTVVPHTHVLSFLTLWPRGQTQPLVSILNSGDGRIKANAAIIPADTSGGISVFTTDDTELVLDVDGYFVSSAASNYNSGLVFYPITPCRVVDTRNANGTFGGPSLSAGTSGARGFPIASSTCSANIPANAQSYALNVTAIPKSGTLTYLTAWPSGQNPPVASVLNAPTGTVMANAAIIPGGAPNGSVSVYVSNPADVVIDISGYFAPPGSGGLSLYPVTPCRALDTRTGSGPFASAITANIGGSSCAPPVVAQAYVFNATVVPGLGQPLAYLTLWQAGTAQPLQSTLNADDGTTMSNMALVLSTNGSVSAYASSSTNLILDIFGYWAP